MTQPDDDSGYVTARHFLICRSVWNDPADPDTGISLGRIVSRLRPPDGEAYPFGLHRLFAYIQLVGDAGEYSVFVEQIRLDTGNDEEPFRFDTKPILVSGDHFRRRVRVPIVPRRI
jgi:hypothetical protein